MDGDIATTEVYQLRIALREISPAIWRRVLVRSDSTTADLHSERWKGKLKRTVHCGVGLYFFTFPRTESGLQSVIDLYI